MAGTNITRFKRLIVVSYRLPYKVVRREGSPRLEQNSGGLVSAILSLSEKMALRKEYGSCETILWVGKNDAEGNEHSLCKEKIPNFSVVPVAIERAIDEKFYGGFCNELLWPLFHYFPSLMVLNEEYYENYRAANKLFADRVKAILRPDDFVWIHDYQLFLTPMLVREAFPGANIGFFLHIPFPVFELFRTIPRRWCEEILKGVLGADCVGFHTTDYCQYFLRTVSRYLGYEVTMNTVTAEDRIVRVDAFPLGIDYEKFNSAAADSPKVKMEKSSLAATLGNNKLIFSIDRLDYSKGLLHRLQAFDYFLEIYPEWIGKIVYNMVVIPSRESIGRYQKMKHEIEAAVGRINGKYGSIAWRPIAYQYKSLSFDELVALYDVSSVGLITPLRDGMNLVSKEYVVCQKSIKGVLILSETAGAAAELSEALLINPTDRKETADAINRALIMPERDRAILLNRMQKRLKEYTVFTWASDFLAGMDLIKKEQDSRKVNVISFSKELDIFTRFASSSKRAIFIDYDGTLVPFAKIPELAVPSAQTVGLLKKLSDNPKNSVVIISGRDKNFLQNLFGQLGVFLIAEHGAFQKACSGEWQCLIDTDQQWKNPIAPVLQRYAKRCTGSFVEEKFSSLVWHYRNSPQEIGALRAKELIEEIRTLVSHVNKLHVLDGTKVVEVKRTGVDKGSASLKFLANNTFDFILAMGDDRTDEDIFRSLPPDSVTIKIGIKQSFAKYNLRNQLDVARFLGRLTEVDEAREEPARVCPA